jgi:hypothetical protein
MREDWERARAADKRAVIQAARHKLAEVVPTAEQVNQALALALKIVEGRQADPSQK